MLLRFSYLFIQLLIFTTFLHYIGESHENFNPTAIECVFYAVEAAQETVHVVEATEASGDLVEASPFVVDALVFASMALLMAERSHYPIAASTTPKQLVSRAIEMLQRLSKKSDAARDCGHLLSVGDTSIFDLSSLI